MKLLSILRTRRLWDAMVAGICVLTVPVQVFAFTPGGWGGVLLDAHGRPMRAAEIHLIGGHGELVARTGEDGRFRFQDVPPNAYELAIVSRGYEAGHGRLVPSPTMQPASRVYIGRTLVVVSPEGRFRVDR